MDVNIEADDFDTGEIAREYVVQEVLQTAFDRAYAQLEEKQLHQEIVEFTVNSCFNSCMALLELTFVSREAQPLDPEPLSEASWQLEEQPQPCAQDTWMRGVVPKRWNQQRQAVAGVEGASPINRAMRTSSMRSTKEHGKPRMSKDMNSSRNGSRRTSQEGSVSGSMRISHDFHSRQKGHGHGHHTHKKGPQQELEDRLREEVAIRKKEHQLHEEMLAQADEEQQKFEALHKQMRGKDYGYDCKGQIVVINALDPDSLPPVATLPLVNTNPGEKKGRPGIPSNKPKDSGGDSPKSKPRAALESEGPDYIPDKKECQPPILDTIKLVSGATIKTPAASQSGPKRVVDLNHMTKRDHARYLIKAASENVVTIGGGASDRRKAAAKSAAQASLPASRVLQSQGSLTGQSQGDNRATAPSPAATLRAPVGQQQQQQPVQQYMRQQSMAPVNPNLALLTEVGDGEQLKWIRDGVPKVKAAKGPQRPDSPPDPNLAILSIADWGNTPNAKSKQPAQLPSKQANAASVVAAALRDRTFKRGNVASIPVAAGLRSDKPTPHVDAYGGSLKWSQQDGQ